MCDANLFTYIQGRPGQVLCFSRSGRSIKFPFYTAVFCITELETCCFVLRCLKPVVSYMELEAGCFIKFHKIVISCAGGNFV